MKGIYARERTFPVLKAERSLIRTLGDTLDGEADAKKLGLACKRISAMKTKSHNLELAGQLLSRLKNLKIFEAYLTKDNHCFDSIEGAKSLTE